MTPMLFCNIAWMETYTGDPADKPLGGGSHPEKAEKYNFKPLNGRMLGYVRATSETIDITKLGAAADASSYEGVDVVWTARHPDRHRRVVVGWYRKATVFRKLQEHPGPLGRSYHFEAKAANCVLLEPTFRNLEVKRAQAVKGGAGRYVWFAESGYGKKLKSKVKKLFEQEFDKNQLRTKASQLVGKIDRPPKGFAKPLKRMQAVVDFGRDRQVHAYVLQRANEHCELCGTPAPFEDSKGVPFLEVHHVKRLADGGPDVPRNAVALCPNCHREAHYGIKQDEIRKKLKRVASGS